MHELADLPAGFAATRESLRALACYAISPARKARTGRIGLRAHDGGIATPPFDDGTRILVRRDALHLPNGEVTPITTVAAAARVLGVELSSDPGVGHDLPEFEPDAPLRVDPDASAVLAAWYAFGQRSLNDLGAIVAATSTVSEAQLWPEHFDLAVSVSDPATDTTANVGFSAGDDGHVDPYAYVGPHDVGSLDRFDAYWNAPFGSILSYRELAKAPEAGAAALRFIGDGLGRLNL
jgi:hypothetical protein